MDVTTTGASLDAQGLMRLAEMAVTSEILTQEGDLASTLQRLAARSMDVTSADFAAIATFDEDGGLTRFIYTGIDELSARRLGHPPVGRGLLGVLARCEGPLRIDDLTTHPNFTGWPEGHPDMCAFLGIPIHAGGVTIGSFYMTRIRGNPPFSDADVLSAAVLALQAAVGVSTAMARERTGRVALLEERERIAHDLHDGTIQALYATGLEYDTLAQRPDFPDDVRSALKQGVSRLNDVIADMRSYIAMLESQSPAAQPDLQRDLAFIIRQLVPQGLDTVVNIAAAALQELNSRDSEDLLYIAREAISNAVRHGQATKVAIDLRQTDDLTALTIQDNGLGFDPATVRTGLGTVTMRTRAARLGADLTVLGIPGMGGTVRVAIPRRHTLDA